MEPSATDMAANPNPNPNPNPNHGAEPLAPAPVSIPAPAASDLYERVSSLEQSVNRLISDKKRSSSQQHLLHMEQQLETCTSPRLRETPPFPYPSMATRQTTSVPCVFQMPVHYPRYRRSDYESMPEWRLDLLLEEYGLPIDPSSSLPQKREVAMGNFLWNSSN